MLPSEWHASNLALQVIHLCILEVTLDHLEHAYVHCKQCVFSFLYLYIPLFTFNKIVIPSIPPHTQKKMNQDLFQIDY